MATGNGGSVYIVCEHLAISSTGRGKAVRRLRGDCTEIVLCRCNCRAISAASAQESHGASAGSVQRQCGDGAVTPR